MSQYSEEEQKRFSDHDPFTCRYVTGSVYDNVQYWRERCEKLEEKIRKMELNRHSEDCRCMIDKVKIEEFIKNDNEESLNDGDSGLILRRNVFDKDDLRWVLMHHGKVFELGDFPKRSLKEARERYIAVLKHSLKSDLDRLNRYESSVRNIIEI